MAGLGVLNGLFLTFGLTHDLDYKVSFAISSGICLAIAFYLLYAIKDGKIEKKTVEQLPLKYF